MEYFHHVQHTQFPLSDRRKYIKKTCAGKKTKAWNKQTKAFPNKWKGKLAKSDKASNYNQEKWIYELEYGKGRYYNEFYDDDLDLVTTDESSCSGELEAESHKDSVPQEIFFAKEESILVFLEKLSAFVNTFTFCKFCNIPVQVEEDNNKSISLT